MGFILKMILSIFAEKLIELLPDLLEKKVFPKMDEYVLRSDNEYDDIAKDNVKQMISDMAIQLQADIKKRKRLW